MQWLLIILSSVALLAVTPLAKTTEAFFAGRKADRMPNVWVLTSSLVISWLFAKSITNAANLGLAFGLAGGVAYAAYYASFVVAGIVLYRIRTRGGFNSIHEFLSSRFGRGALLLFSLLIAFRLFNEVWSNTMVIGSYFGPEGSSGYIWSIVIFTLLTLAYSLKGGMSSSLLSDVIQMVLFGVLLVVILGAILSVTGANELDYQTCPACLSDGRGSNAGFGHHVVSGSWTMAMGGNLLFAALIQSLSYPFHDPVLTDRGFISSPKTTLKSYLWAAPIGAASIILFSFVGVYGQYRGVTGQAPVEVAKLLGPVIMLVMNFIMVTSAASTLDSTFASFSKLVVVDMPLFNRRTPLAERLEPKLTSRSESGVFQSVSPPDNSVLDNIGEVDDDRGSVSLGRLAMVIVTVLGSLPIFLGAEILSATTVSGTMVIGLAPVFTLWWLKPPVISFYASVAIGLLLGICLINGWWPEHWNFTNGKYADLLSINLYGTLACYLAYLLPLAVRKQPEHE
ncbi:sodium:solute symporter [Lewinellaceae bacterium SD302]|nr:sodium:solute symporter [Lewinellaceae bacterium SD302]